jgi:hypothetical protein
VNYGEEPELHIATMEEEEREHEREGGEGHLYMPIESC